MNCGVTTKPEKMTEHIVPERLWVERIIPVDERQKIPIAMSGTNKCGNE